MAVVRIAVGWRPRRPLRPVPGWRPLWRPGTRVVGRGEGKPLVRPRPQRRAARPAALRTTGTHGTGGRPSGRPPVLVSVSTLVGHPQRSGVRGVAPVVRPGP